MTQVTAQHQAVAMVANMGVDVARQAVQGQIAGWRESQAHANHHNLSVSYMTAQEEIEYWSAVLVAIDALESAGAV